MADEVQWTQKKFPAVVKLWPLKLSFFVVYYINVVVINVVCAWGNCPLIFQRKIVILQKRALRLIYFSKSKEHTVPFFLKSNCLPPPSQFFRDCSYLLYDINRQTTISQMHNYRTRSVSRDTLYVKFSRTDKMHAFFSRIVPKFSSLLLIRWNYLRTFPLNFCSRWNFFNFYCS